jgi:thymidine phosphorylase
LAESLDALVLDVKFGQAAFMQTKSAARKLAQGMVALGNECGTNTRAILTDMHTPLGRAAGNWLEVKESVACLEPVHRVHGRPATSLEDLRGLVLECAAHLLLQTRKCRSLAAGRKQAESCLNSGAPRRKWDEMIAAQGADLKAFHQKLRHDSTAGFLAELKSEKAGFISRCHARIIGEVIRDLGGGRLTKESSVNYDVGVDQMAKPGERVETGGVLCRIHAANAAQARTVAARLKTAFEISPRRVRRAPLVVEIIG